MAKKPPAAVKKSSKKKRNKGGDPKRRLRTLPLGQGLPNLTKMRVELADMTDVLMGREEPPIWAGHLTLMEVADGYYARASELTMKIQEAETDGRIDRGSSLYKFRTGELRTFTEMCKRASDLGSRRLTKEQLQFEMASHGRESKGFQ